MKVLKTSPTPDYPGDARLSGGFRYQTPTVYEWRQYNGFGQLIRVLQDEGETAYQYRGDGMRHSRETKRLTEPAATMTVYLWDGSHIVGEQRTGKPVQFYLRGHNLIARQHDGVLDYYLLNEHGDVTHLRDQSGSRIASYRYDAFGQEKEPWADDENPFRYCGEYFDTETNTVYLRNRDYRSSTGRFTQEDAHWNPDNMIYGDNPIKWNRNVSNNATSSFYKPNVSAMRQTGNRYLYGMNNPICYKDPTGAAVTLAGIDPATFTGLDLQSLTSSLQNLGYEAAQSVPELAVLIGIGYIIWNGLNWVCAESPPLYEYEFPRSMPSEATIATSKGRAEAIAAPSAVPAGYAIASTAILEMEPGKYYAAYLDKEITKNVWIGPEIEEAYATGIILLDNERLGVFTWNGADARNLVSKVGPPYLDNIHGGGADGYYKHYHVGLPNSVNNHKNTHIWYVFMN